MYLLDTNITVFLGSRRLPTLNARIFDTPLDQMFVSVISVQERFVPLESLIKNEKLAPEVQTDYCRMLRQAMVDICRFQILPYEADARDLFKTLGMATIRRCGGVNDAKIACIAAARGPTVVTQNTRDFEVLQEKLIFRCEDWTK